MGFSKRFQNQLELFGRPLITQFSDTTFDIVNPVNFYMNPEMIVFVNDIKHWIIDENITAFDWEDDTVRVHTRVAVVTFHNKDDAMKFKLRWL